MALGYPYLTTTAPVGSPAASDKATASAVSSTPAPIALTHAQKWFLSFDYPKAWTLTDLNTLSPETAYRVPWVAPGPEYRREISAQTPFVFSVGFVGNGTASEVCDPVTDGAVPTCVTTWHLPEGSVVVRVRLDGQAGLWNAESTLDGTSTLPGYSATTIDGLPALFARTAGVTYQKAAPKDLFFEKPETIPGADEILTWVTSPPQRLSGTYEIVAAIRGPHQDALESQVRALVDSLHWSPEPVPIPSEAGALDAAKKVAVARAFNLIRSTMAADGRTPVLAAELAAEAPQYFDCFSIEPGASVSGKTTGSPQGPLTRALPVTCKTEIVPNSVKGWTLSLTQSWVAGRGYSAGWCTMTLYLNTDGTIAGSDSVLNNFMQRALSYPFRAAGGA
jgi:hypothetical protein